MRDTRTIRIYFKYIRSFSNMHGLWRVHVNYHGGECWFPMSGRSHLPVDY